MKIEFPQSQAAYNIKKLTLIFLKYRREVWAAVENDLKHNLKPRLRGDYRNGKN